jgi:hypothetical protein
MLYEIRSVALAVPFDAAFDYLGDMTRLPEGTNAFAAVAPDGDALMRTPAGEVPVRLTDRLDRATGVIDTTMTFPDGATTTAFSRLIPLGAQACAYSFVLTPPPVALEELEGSLAEQAAILEAELAALKARLERVPA